jgi:hypothetical protein
MIRKALGMLTVAGLGALVASQWRDIVRYVKIKELSREGKPGLVPASGRAAYPADASKASADGENDFDSARRGGPAAS